MIIPIIPSEDEKPAKSSKRVLSESEPDDLCKVISPYIVILSNSIDLQSSFFQSKMRLRYVQSMLSKSKRQTLYY